MKDHQKQTEVNDLISLVESMDWKQTSQFDDWAERRVKLVMDLYDRLKAAKQFVPPTEEEVELFMALELQHWPTSPSVTFYTQAEARKFVAFYASKGWMVGRNKMKDWQAAARGWMARNAQSKTPPIPKPTSIPVSDDPRLY
jgi:hypothetical protein